MIEKIKNYFSNIERSESGNSKLKKWMRRLWMLSLLGLIGVVATIYYLSNQNLPTLKDLANPQNKLATEIYDNEGAVLGRYFRENRVNVPFDEINPIIVKALVSTEDERFFDHSGIDAYGLTRAIARFGKDGGASTITQQLAKLLYTKRAPNIFKRLQQKVKEWITAVKIEKKYTKKEILAMYLNKFNFNYGAYGIKAASEVYFGKSQKDLTIEEAAVLIGMLKNPSLFNPKKRLERTQLRRDVVMKQMVRNDALKQVDYDSLRLIPLTMDNFSRRSHDEGSALYFLMELRKTVNGILDEPSQFKADGSKYDIYEDGLRIYTTVDSKMQLLAEKEMEKHMAQQQKTFFNVWKDLDPWTYRDDEDVTDREIEIRGNSLRQKLRESNRYYQLRLKVLGKNIGAIHDKFEFSIKDFDVDRILKAEVDPTYFDQLLSSKLTSKDKIKTYKKIKKSEEWKSFKKQWNILQDKTKKDFDKPVKMKVFAYNPAGEKDTIFSPLDSIRYNRMILQVGSLGVDPGTGEVKFWVGGVNFKYFQFDHLRSNRQVGSTFKPFVYGTAISLQGMSPCEKVKDVGYTIEPGEGRFYLDKPWTPSNADGKYTGEMLTLKEAMKQSKNTVSVFLMKQLGDAQPVRELAKNMGIDTDSKRTDGERRVPIQPSICLGAADLNVLEMTGAYTTFANNGTYNKPRFIKKIVDKNGRVLYESIPEERRAMNPKYNYVLVDMLRNVTRGAYGFGKIKSDVGGKTGTTNGYTDGWFMGITPSLVVGTWVGGEDPWIRFKSLANGQGARMARPFFANLITAIEQDSTIEYNTNKRFVVPKGETLVEMDCDIYYDSPTDLDSDYQHNNDQPGFDDDPWDDEPQDSTSTITIPEDDEEPDF